MLYPTKQQLRVLAWIKQFVEEHGYPPSVAEISRGMGYKSRMGALTHLLALQRKGVIEYGRKARAISIKEEWR